MLQTNITDDAAIHIHAASFGLLIEILHIIVTTFIPCQSFFLHLEYVSRANGSLYTLSHLLEDVVRKPFEVVAKQISCPLRWQIQIQICKFRKSIGLKFMTENDQDKKIYLTIVRHTPLDFDVHFV